MNDYIKFLKATKGLWVCVESGFAKLCESLLTCSSGWVVLTPNNNTRHQHLEAWLASCAYKWNIKCNLQKGSRIRGSL